MNVRSRSRQAPDWGPMDRTISTYSSKLESLKPMIRQSVFMSNLPSEGEALGRVQPRAHGLADRPTGGVFLGHAPYHLFVQRDVEEVNLRIVGHCGEDRQQAGPH